jgi:HAD superfamily hydrolase (TIGR01509 family)
MTSIPAAILFDLDGVLVQTEPLKAEAHAAAVARLGGSALPAVYEEVMGHSQAVVRAAFLAAGGIDAEAAAYDAAYDAAYQDLLATQLAVAPGVEALLQHLGQQGHLLAVVSSSPAQVMDGILERTGLARFFQIRVSGDDVAHHKPAPDAYLLALARLGTRPEAALAVEDTDAGVQAAREAGLQVVAVRHELNSRHRFAGAVAVIEALQPDLTGLQDLSGLGRSGAIASPGQWRWWRPCSQR